MLDPVSGAKVTFFHGWSEDVFLGTERVCIVPENLLQAAGQDADGSPAVTIDYLGRQVTLKIVGHGQRTDGCDDLVPVLCDHDRRTDRELFR